MKNQYVENNLITETEIEQLISDINAFVQNDDYLVSFVRTTQIYGKKQ